DALAYRFGFHGLVAWLHWCRGAGVGELVGLTGHLVNAAVALGVAFLVLRVLGDGTVGWLAAWLVALMCVFPAYFVNWGRFTQAGGVLLLPLGAPPPNDRRAPPRLPRPRAGGGGGWGAAPGGGALGARGGRGAGGGGRGGRSGWAGRGRGRRWPPVWRSAGSRLRTTAWSPCSRC